MKSNELRIGNLVYGINRRSEIHLPENVPLVILQIGPFNCEGIPLGTKPEQEENWFKISNCDLSPIPFTEEWLKKADYKKRLEFDIWVYADGVWIYGNDQAGFFFNYLTKNRKLEFVLKNRKLEFVHTFQNLHFALTGKEPEIK